MQKTIRIVKSFMVPLTLVCCTVVAQGQTVPVSVVVQCEKFSENHGGYYPDPPPPHEPRIAVQYLGEGDWIRFDSVNLMAGEFDSVAFYYVGYNEVDWSTVGHRARLRLDSPQGTELAVFPLDNTFNGAARPSAQALSTSLSGYHTLFLTFDGDDTVCSRADRIVFTGTATLNASDAATYYVAPYGDDGNDGLSIDRPFRTIQQAASRMKPGSICNIRQGVYRETVTPVYTGTASAPLIFQAYGNESVYISGADPVGGWTRHSGNIYKAEMGWTMGKYRNQLLIDGTTAIVARSPNINDPQQSLPTEWAGTINPQGFANMVHLQNEIHPLLTPTRVMFWAQSDSYYGQDGHMKHGAVEYTYEDFIPSYMLGKPADFYKGGLLSLQNSWWVNVAEITGSTPAPSDLSGFYITSESINMNGFEGSNGPGYISYLLPLLDQPNEWYLDSTGTVYLWAPDGADLSASHHLVEAKRRLVGFDLTNKRHVTLKGLRFLCTSTTLAEAWYCTIDDCHWKYPSYYDAYEWWEEFSGPRWYESPYDPSDGFSGVYIGGGYNVVKNSSSTISAGSGFILSGRGHHTVTNCIIHDCNWLPTYNAGIRTYKHDISIVENGGGMLMEKNTIYNCGRANIEVDGGGDAAVDGEQIRIMHNDLGRCGWLADEVTSIVPHVTPKLEIAYNRFHSVCGYSAGFTQADPTFGCYGNKVHHNVFYRGDPVYDSPYDRSACHWVIGAGDTAVRIFNNTAVDSIHPGHFDWDLWPMENFPAKCFANNIMWNAGDKSKWKYTDPANDDYTLQAGSPAIDAGVLVPGWVEEGDYIGNAPDLGAFEFGMPAWSAGADWEEETWTYPPSAVTVGVVPADPARRPKFVPRLQIGRHALVVSVASGTAFRLMIYNMQGAMVQSRNSAHGGMVTIPTAHMPAGIYALRVKGGKNQSVLWKVCLRQPGVAQTR